ncbi:MAG: amino acid ABC transporter permease [Burkholderiaceae bacterium]|jgi:general L-amino acid transport system permease protein
MNHRYAGRLSLWAAWRLMGKNHPMQFAFSWLLACAVAWLVWQGLGWAVWKAIWSADLEACRRLGGACWGVITEKHAVILWGRYPAEYHWRPASASALILLAALNLYLRPSRRFAWGMSLSLIAASLTIMHGIEIGRFGLPVVSSNQWGGLPLTLYISLGTLFIGLPIGLLLALLRRSSTRLVARAAGVFIDLLRGVPLVAVLFVASLVYPLIFPDNTQTNTKLQRVIIAMGLFAGAYLAEVIRSGLQAVSFQQVEAGRALGMRYWQVQRHIVWPQAFRKSIPALVNSFISILKDSALVTVVGLYELTGSLSLAIGGDPQWRSFYLEAYLFVALIYWLMCFGLSSFGRRLESSPTLDKRECPGQGAVQ